MLNQVPFIDIAYDPTVAYDDLPLLPPSLPPVAVGNTVVKNQLETVPLLKACITARVLLAELNVRASVFSSQQLLQRVFPLMEAHANASLDGVSTPIEVLFRLPAADEIADHQRSPAIDHVLAIDRALANGFAATTNKPLDISLLLDLATDINGKPESLRRGAPTASGQLENYLPPCGAETLQRLLLNWQEFVRVDAGSLDPLIIMAVAHYQLNVIQPFNSGNDAVVRLVDSLLMSDELLIDRPLLNLSAWYRRNRAEYLRLQVAVTQQQCWHEWIEFVLRGVAECAQLALKRLQVIETLRAQTESEVRRTLPRQFSAELIELLFEEPCIRIQDLVRRGIAKRQTASVYLKKLCDQGILTEITQGKEKLFLHTRLIRVLTNDTFQYESFSSEF